MKSIQISLRTIISIFALKQAYDALSYLCAIVSAPQYAIGPKIDAQSKSNYYWLIVNFAFAFLLATFARQIESFISTKGRSTTLEKILPAEEIEGFYLILRSLGMFAAILFIGYSFEALRSSILDSRSYAESLTQTSVDLLPWIALNFTAALVALFLPGMLVPILRRVWNR